MKGRRFDFPVNDWMDAKEGVFAQSELTLSSNGFHDQPLKPAVQPQPLGLSAFFSFYFIFFCYQSRYIFFICKRTVKLWHVITDVLNKLTLIAVFFLSITKMTAPSLANMVELV